MKIAVVGATGLVGSEMLKVLEERNFPVTALYPVASERSIGKEIQFRRKNYKVVSAADAIAAKPQIALFSAGGTISKELAPAFANAGAFVIDNSSAWRMEDEIPLVVPEVNADKITQDTKIIANPNCSTIQMVVVLAPLYKKYGIRRVVVSTYQSVTGTGVKAVKQLEEERAGKEDAEMAYHYAIDLNCIPHCDVFLENDYTKEEMKLFNETRKILNDDTIGVTATAVRVPVIGGHSEAVNITFEKSFKIDDVKKLLAESPGIIVQDNPAENQYPQPLFSKGKDDVFVGRIRRDESFENTLNLWIVADNLRKGAATNAIQIAEYLHKKGLV